MKCTLLQGGVHSEIFNVLFGNLFLNFFWFCKNYLMESGNWLPSVGLLRLILPLWYLMHHFLLAIQSYCTVQLITSISSVVKLLQWPIGTLMLTKSSYIVVYFCSSNNFIHCSYFCSSIHLPHSIMCLQIVHSCAYLQF